MTGQKKTIKEGAAKCRKKDERRIARQGERERLAQLVTRKERKREGAKAAKWRRVVRKKRKGWHGNTGALRMNASHCSSGGRSKKEAENLDSSRSSRKRERAMEKQRIRDVVRPKIGHQDAIASSTTTAR